MTHPAIIANAHGSYPDAFYTPDPIVVHVGQRITWTNKDNDIHDVIANNEISFASPPLPQGGTFSWTPTRPGRYRYFCSFHPEMRGTVVVQPKPKG